MGLEMIAEVPDLDYLVVPIGGGGMIAGVVAAIKTNHPHVRILVSFSITIKTMYLR